MWLPCDAGNVCRTQAAIGLPLEAGTRILAAQLQTDPPMSHFEYKVVPAPQKAPKVKGASSVEARFAHSLAAELNGQARDGWEFQRAETLPVDERAGLTGHRTSFKTVLIYRRLIEVDETEATREALRLLADRRDG